MDPAIHRPCRWSDLDLCRRPTANHSDGRTLLQINGAHDARINNWSAARDSATDFNNNSRRVQGGVGFAGDPPFSATFRIPTFSITASRKAPARPWTSRHWAQTSAPSILRPKDPADLAGRTSLKRIARPAMAAPSGPRARCSISTIRGTMPTPPLARDPRRAP